MQELNCFLVHAEMYINFFTYLPHSEKIFNQEVKLCTESYHHHQIPFSLA